MFLKELTDKFGGATSFVEIMTERLARDYWRSLREA